MNGISTLNLSNGTITYSNDYLSLTDSADNTNVIVDIDSKYFNTTSSLSTLFYQQSTINSMLSSYQPILSTGSNANSAYLLYNNKTKHISVLNGISTLSLSNETITYSNG